MRAGVRACMPGVRGSLIVEAATPTWCATVRSFRQVGAVMDVDYSPTGQELVSGEPFFLQIC
jgi:hypothetical protein|eukprot:COSAG01_NODE_1026_length_12047_cov_169.108554_9_plen_62_part_00